MEREYHGLVKEMHGGRVLSLGDRGGKRKACGGGICDTCVDDGFLFG